MKIKTLSSVSEQRDATILLDESHHKNISISQNFALHYLSYACVLRDAKTQCHCDTQFAKIFLEIRAERRSDD